MVALFLVGCSGMDHSLENLKSQSCKDRAAAIYWLCTNVQSPTNKKLVSEALQKDKSDLVRSLAVRLMALDGDVQFIPLIHNALQDSSALVRMEAAQSLGSYKDYQALPQLTAVIEKEHNAWVRLKILKSIEHMRAAQTVPALIGRLEDTEPAVRFQALLLLQKFTGQQIAADKESWQKWFQQKNKSDAGKIKIDE
jgi:HEAT repeat protein